MNQAADERLRQGYIVERYQPGVTIRDALCDTDRVATAAARIARDRVDITYLGTVLLLADEALLEVFAAAAEEPVRAVHELARTRVARITQALLIAPRPSSSTATSPTGTSPR